MQAVKPLTYIEGRIQGRGVSPLYFGYETVACGHC
jgi:hypothetical protein